METTWTIILSLPCGSVISFTGHNMFTRLFILSMGFYCCAINAQPVIDEDVLAPLQKEERFQSQLVFFKSINERDTFVNSIKEDNNLSVNSLDFMPVAIVTFAPSAEVSKRIASFPGVAYIGLNRPASEKETPHYTASQSTVSARYPGIELWRKHGFNGQTGVLGLIDSGIAPDHPALSDKQIIINKNPSSGYQDYPHGVRTAHGTGVGCIYAGFQHDTLKHFKGIAYKMPVILSTLAGEGTDRESSFWLTYAGLNWLLSPTGNLPTVINYSFGNGDVTCDSCPDWSGMAKIVDYIINHNKILWVTSAGNNGYIKQNTTAPFVSTMTIPAESYNALTVANMNTYSREHSTYRKYNQLKHAIYHSSSRGPTLIGRKKPDIAAPGNNTLTCAPDPETYQLTYTDAMQYKDGYRYMGGTSSAAPQVGAAALLLKDAGISHPAAIKALLINSAETWTDSNAPGPDDPDYPYQGGHHKKMGSEWNPTYGWGYLNLKKAFYQRNFIIEDKLTLENPVRMYLVKMRPQDKITLVHERRVGFNDDGHLWELSHLILEIFDPVTKKLLHSDDSAIDNVHQVSLCNRTNLDQCFQDHSSKVIVKVSLKSFHLDGSDFEKFALSLPSKRLHSAFP